MKKIMLIMIVCASSIQAMTPDERVQKALRNLKDKGKSILTMPDSFFAYVRAKASPTVQDEVNVLVAQAQMPITQKDEKNASWSDRAYEMWESGKAGADRYKAKAVQWVKDNPKAAATLAAAAVGAAYGANKLRERWNAQAEAQQAVEEVGSAGAQELREEIKRLETGAQQRQEIINQFQGAEDDQVDVLEARQNLKNLKKDIQKLRKQADELELSSIIESIEKGQRRLNDEDQATKNKIVDYNWHWAIQQMQRETDQDQSGKVESEVSRARAARLKLKQ